MTYSRHNAAFTVTELLVACALLIVVIAAFFPIAGEIRDTLLQTRCMSNLRSFGIAALNYAHDHNGLPRWNGKGINDLEGTTRPAWEKWVRPYLHQRFENRLRCPKIPKKYLQPGASNYVFNYGGNSALCIYYPTLKGFPVPHSKIIFATECGDHEIGFNHVVHLNIRVWGISESVASGDRSEFEANESDLAQYHGPPDRRGLNFFFLDGHMEYVQLEKGKDWRDKPFFGGPDGVGYFFDRNQFKDMVNYPEKYH